MNGYDGFIVVRPPLFMGCVLVNRYVLTVSIIQYEFAFQRIFLKQW